MFWAGTRRRGRLCHWLRAGELGEQRMGLSCFGVCPSWVSPCPLVSAGTLSPLWSLRCDLGMSPGGLFAAAPPAEGPCAPHRDPRRGCSTSTGTAGPRCSRGSCSGTRRKVAVSGQGTAWAAGDAGASLSRARFPTSLPKRASPSPSQLSPRPRAPSR